MNDDEVNVTRREFERLILTVDSVVRDLTGLRIELAVLKTKIAIFASLFGVSGAGAVELARHIFAK